MNSECKYSDIFGKSRTGIHSYRVFDIAIVDVVLTIILIYYYYLNNYCLNN